MRLSRNIVANPGKLSYTGIGKDNLRQGAAERGEAFVRSAAIAMCQIRTEVDRRATFEQAETMIRRAAADGAEIVVLPEMFFCPYVTERFREFAEPDGGEACAAMADWARENRVVLVGGTFPERDGERLYNTCFVYDESGRRLAKYRKTHLFKINLKDGTAFRESDTFTAGGDLCVFDTRFGRLGLAICFDLRFPELFRALAERGAELILVPAQFTMKTGSLHWEKLITTRALDNELFVAGVSAARNPASGYTCWGHSLLADPFGAVLAECGTEPAYRIARIDFDEIARVRAELPTFLHPRRDLYPVAD